MSQTVEPNQQAKLDPRNPKDAVAILSLATEQLAGPNAGSRQFAVAVQVALETLSQLANPPKDVVDQGAAP